MIQDIQNHFEELPAFLTTKMPRKTDLCARCENNKTQMVAHELMVEDLKQRLKECEIQNNMLQQEKTELVEYVGFLEDKLEKEREENKQNFGSSRKRQLSLIFEEDGESNSD